MDHKNDVENGFDEPAAPVFHCMNVSDIVEMLNTDVSKGLTDDEASKRLLRDGPNRMTEGKKISIWIKIWNQLRNVLVLILIVVAIISLVKAITSTDASDQLTSYIEVVLIIGVVVLNTWISIRQEGSAEKSAEALKNMLSSAATVVRGGVKMEVPAEDLVVGDIVSLSLGDRIPADLRMTKVVNMSAQEAALTGESVPIEKNVETMDVDDPEHVPLGDRKNLAFSATAIVQGDGIGIVVCTGDDTEIGKINGLVQSQKTKKTNVLKQIDVVSRWIAIFVCITALATFLIAFLTGQEALEAVTTGLVTAVAMIPEGLVAIVTLTYAWAVSNMAKSNAIVRVLPSVETLGSVTVICSDKTGTLTQNIMSMVAFVVSDGRFRVNINSIERSPNNFVRDDTYMTQHKNEYGKHNTTEDSTDRNNPEENGAGMIDLNANKNENHDDVLAREHGESPTEDYVRSLLSTGILCSKAELPVDGGREGALGNPTEIAIIRAAFFAGTDHTALRIEQPEVATVPFSSEYKFMATVHNSNPSMNEDSNTMTVHVKGALDRLLPLCKNQTVSGIISTVENLNAVYWVDQADQLASHGYRVLCLCRGIIPYNSVKQDESLGREFVDGKAPWLTMVGLAVIQDPPRPECVEAIKEAHGASVRVVMITGDHKSTAIAIGEELGIVDDAYPDAITGPEMDALSDRELRVAVMRYNVYARSSPENKLRIVKALQAEGEVCSMTGDGVNDAPALKAADMGVAMGKEGTDVARESAEMILADDNFATIVVAVREGRVVWDNLRKVLLFNTPVNNAQGLTVTFGIIGLPYSPLTPIQVLYCNLICAVTLGFVLAVEPAEDGIMANPPRKVGKRLIGRYLLFRIAFASVILVAVTVGSVFWVRSWSIDIDIPPSNETMCLAAGVDLVNMSDTELNKCCLMSLSCDVFEANDCQNVDYSTASSISPERSRNGDTLCPNVLGRALVRAQASNTLTISAISVMLSARFAYNSAIHKRIIFGNKWAWASAFVTAALQVLITYVPGLNNIVFSVGPMNGAQWGICILFVFVTFFCMEFEKGLMRFLKSRKFDTDDLTEKHELPEVLEPFVSTLSQRSAALHDTLLKR